MLNYQRVMGKIMEHHLSMWFEWVYPLVNVVCELEHHHFE